MHNHIGNILYPSGGGLAFSSGIKFPPSRGLQYLDEKYLFRDKPLGVMLNKLFPNWSVNCERKRNAAATLQNFQKSMIFHFLLIRQGFQTLRFTGSCGLCTRNSLQNSASMSL